MSGEKRRCKALKAGGGRCSLPAQPGQDTCWSHSRETAEQRRINAAAGGFARSRHAPSELEQVKAQLRGIAANVLRGDLDRGTAAVLNQLLGSVLRTIELQRRLDHMQELEDRLAELEDEVARRTGVMDRWGGSSRTGWRG